MPSRFGAGGADAAAWRPGRPVLVRRHRGYRLEVHEDGGEGWVVVVRPPAGSDGAPERLRSSMPSGLEALLGEARGRVDRRLDGGREGPGRL